MYNVAVDIFEKVRKCFVLYGQFS